MAIVDQAGTVRSNASCERNVALDLTKHALEPYDRLSVSWNVQGGRRGSFLVVDDRDITITYHVCDPVGRFRNSTHVTLTLDNRT
jgi:hypothetical protein